MTFTRFLHIYEEFRSFPLRRNILQLARKLEKELSNPLVGKDHH